MLFYSDVSVSSMGGTPTATYKAGRMDTGCISGTRAAPHCTPTTELPPHMCASRYGASGISTVACTLATATHVHLHDDQCTCINSATTAG